MVVKHESAELSAAARARTLLEHATGSPFVDGNSIEVLQNGDEIFPAMLQAIDAAEYRIDFATFVYWTGDIAARFASALARRSNDGLSIRVLLDAFGARRMQSELLDLLAESGAEIRWFRPLSTWRLWRSDKRMHRKLMICDAEVAFTGGVGIAKEWEGNARNPDEWRDTHVAVRGPSISSLRAAFLDNWNEAGDWFFETETAVPATQAANLPVQVMRASTTIGWTDAATLLRSLISLSKSRLRLVTAYFNPGELLVDLLLAAKLRGVDVQIMVPGQYCDSRLSQLAGHKHLQKLLDANIVIWRYERTMLHAKVAIVDSLAVSIGSVNLNHRSLGKDEECSIVALSPEIARQLEQRFVEDCQGAQRYDAETWSKRSLVLRIKESLARLLVEQL